MAGSAHGVPCAPALRRRDLVTHPQVLAADILIETEHPVAGPLRQTRTAARFEGTVPGPPRGAPLIGQHNVEVPREVGLSDAAIDALSPPAPSAASTWCRREPRRRTLLCGGGMSPQALFVLRFPELVSDTLVTADIGEAVATVRTWGKTVLKPTDGMARRDILRLCPDDPDLRSILETATARGRRHVVVQRWIPEAEHGDRRVIVLDGEPIGAVRRIAAPGEFRCNMAAGAAVVADEVTAVDKHICAALAPELARLGLVFTGIDVIGHRLTEVNVTSPTGLREIDALSGTRLPDLVVGYLERRVRER